MEHGRPRRCDSLERSRGRLCYKAERGCWWNYQRNQM
jgi:hypothetical protein